MANLVWNAEVVTFVSYGSSYFGTRYGSCEGVVNETQPGEAGGLAGLGGCACNGALIQMGQRIPGRSERKVARATRQATNSQGMWDSESNQGTLATRNPKVLFVLAGEVS
jgi:hypothetical protein